MNLNEIIIITSAILVILIMKFMDKILSLRKYNWLPSDCDEAEKLDKKISMINTIYSILIIIDMLVLIYAVSVYTGI